MTGEFACWGEKDMFSSYPASKGVFVTPNTEFISGLMSDISVNNSGWFHPSFWASEGNAIYTGTTIRPNSLSVLVLLRL